MNDPKPISVTDEPPTPGRAETPHRSRALPLAIAILVLGIAGFWSPYLYVSGFLAVVFGHIARKRIPAKTGNDTLRIVALAGLVVGYFSIFAGLNGRNDAAMLNKARSVTSLATATALETAVTNFQTEYGEMPAVDSHVTTDSEAGIHLLKILLGKEQSQRIQNLRNIKFLSVREGKNRKNGLIYDSSGSSVEGLFDPWGYPYIVELDTDYDAHLHFKMGSKTIDLKGRRVAVYSPGKDGKPGTSDDVTTW